VWITLDTSFSQNGQVVAVVGMKDKKAVSLLILFSYPFLWEMKAGEQITG